MMKDYLAHEGVAHDDGPPGRGSGRYAWGSGENPGQHQFNFLSEYSTLRKRGISQAEIAKMLLGPKGYTKDGKPIWSTTTDLRAEVGIQRTTQRKMNMEQAAKLLAECNNNISEVARRMGKNESSIRSLLDPVKAERTDRYRETAEMIKKRVNEVGLVDVGSGSEYALGCPETTKKVALSMLEKEGYVITKVQVEQLGTDKKTTMLVIAKPGTEKRYIQEHKLEVKGIENYTPDEGKTWWTPEFPTSVDSKRIMVRYAEDGGKQKDGVIELRKGTEDLSLNGSMYSQVRIAVDGTHYMKGMAIYADDMPKGVDIIYNTNKKKGTPLIGEQDHEVLKRLKIDNRTGEVDRENPFGANIKSPKEKNGVIQAGGQHHYIDKNGVDRLSPINKLQDEGDWDSWSKNLASQFLSKQSDRLIKQQLDLTIADRKNELDSIKRLTNPVIKQKLLDDFASNCDANASDLSARGFRNQKFQVLLPVPSLKDNEVYAPNFKDGDVVALIRYPHGGPFEIPILKVNNKNKEALSILGKNARDAVGINEKNAEKLSGADYDGDSAIVIPIQSNRIKITASDTLSGLDGFDPKSIYKLPDSAPRMKSQTKQNEMGRVTNLITDMSVAGANENEICRAVKHSMVVIDAEKHHLDYKKSAIDNNIQQLKKDYQGVNERGQTKGASTILSRASAEIYVNKRKEVTDVKKMTPEQRKRWEEGKKVWVDTGETKTTRKVLKDGTVVEKVSPVQTKISQMDFVDDAFDLVRDKTNTKEVAYATFANELKSLANEARRESRNIKPTPVDVTAKKTYAKEVASLNAKLNIALSNSPRERQAQVIGNSIAYERINSNPGMDHEHRQREKGRALVQARAIVGAKKDLVIITDSEWDAIQAGAISTNKLKKILLNTDQEAFKQRATPKDSNKELSTAQINLIKAMAATGMYTQKDIADRLGVSTTTVSNTIKS